VLAFADPEIIRLAQQEFVPVVGDDWYQRRRDDAEGRFFRSVSDQAGRGSRGPNGGSTRQAIYCLTASGKLLSCKNAGQSPAATLESLRAGLAAWNRLPAPERKPGAVKVEDFKADPAFHRAPPPGTLILNVYTRALDRAGPSQYRCAESKVEGVRRVPQRDHLWLTEAECKALIPADPKKGDTVRVPDAVSRRIFRFHLVDGTLGEPMPWGRDEVRSGTLTVTVEEASAAGVRLRLDGAALMATGVDPAKAARGYDVRLLGYLNYNAAKKAIDRFDVVALGDCWGKNPVYDQGRRGRTPLGIAFELARGGGPADRVPPQGARWLPGYLDPNR
jgi:hypothetical protein